jgi:hypothetical protein
MGFTDNIDFIALIEPLVRHFFGEPNQRLSKNGELRFGTHGSLAVDLKKGTWFDHETQEGGGALALVERQTGLRDADRFDWLREQGFISSPDSKGDPLGRIVATYPYRDEQAEVLFEVVRLEPKDFRQRRPDPSKPGGWSWSVKGVRQVPYRLPELIEAISTERVIFVVEGEKDCEAMWARGQPATCNAGGVGKWRAELNDFFRGADVVIIADNDPQAKNSRTGELLFHSDGRPRFPGRDHAHQVAAELIEVAARVRVLDLGKHWKECPLKGDVSGFFAAHHTVDELYQIVAQLPVADPPQAANESTAFGYTWRLFWHGEVPVADCRPALVQDLLPETGTALISGQWGTYKTFVAMDLSASVMTKTDFIQFPVMRQGGVLFIACEGYSEVAIRLTAAFEARGGQGKAPFAWVTGCPRLLDRNASKILAAMVKHAAAKTMQEFGLPVALVIIDTAGKAAGLTKDGQLNDDAAAKIIMKALGDASAETGALFVGVAHFGKNKDVGTKGSTGFEDDADVVLALLGERGIKGVVEDPHLCARKRRSGPNGEEFSFRTHITEMGVNQVGTPLTTLVLHWTGQAEPTAKPKADKDPWATKSVRHLRQVMMNMLVDCGTDQRPFPDGPMVRAVDIEIVRAEFYKSYPADGDHKAKQEVRRKAFRRALTDAQGKNLIGARDIGNVTYLWLATPASPPIEAPGRSNGRARNESPTSKPYEILGPAAPGERCTLCGKAGCLRIKRGGEVDLWHEACAQRYLAAVVDPPITVPDLGPDPLDEHGVPIAGPHSGDDA